MRTLAELPAAGRSAVDELVADEDAAWFPPPVESLGGPGVRRGDLEELFLKTILNRGPVSAAEVAAQARLPRTLVADFLRQMKTDGVLAYARNAGLVDYLHELTEVGRERAARAHHRCTYFGADPVGFDEYVAAVGRQSLREQTVTIDALKAALSDLHVGAEVFSQVGMALSSVGALFLHGPPGNGKSSIAERLVKAYDPSVWIPRAVRVSGEVVRLFDPSVHEELPVPLTLREAYDERWVQVARPTVVVGGELTLAHLEFAANPVTGVLEAPVQMKANGGTLVVDDFGRQRCSVEALLNRWIVPLEKGYDYLNTPNGRKVQVPFDLLTVFATNLEPRDLVDEAFLRRIPYKIQTADPTPDEFRALTRITAERMGIDVDGGAVEDLLVRHFEGFDRPLRFCHPRDLLAQVRTFCDFHGRPRVADRETFDAAVKNYFGAL